MFEEFLYKKSGWKIYSKLVGCSNFPKYFYIKTLWKVETISIHIRSLWTWNIFKSIVMTFLVQECYGSPKNP